MEENNFENIPSNERKWYEDFNTAASNIGQGIGGFAGGIAGGIFGGIVDPLKTETKNQTTEVLQPQQPNSTNPETKKNTIFIAVAAGLVVLAVVALLMVNKK